jgi:hypothetical protein
MNWGGPVRVASISAAALIPLLFLACSTAKREAAIRSVYTEFGGSACKSEVDKSDPNETPYLLCGGVGGYRLIVRRVDAGRESIDVVDAGQRVSPLNYEESVTRYMSNLTGKAEWRIGTKDGKSSPIALIVRVQAREDNEHPEAVTRTYLAVAKITPKEACVTDAIPEGTRGEAEVRSLADSAGARPCAPPRPRLTDGGVVVR